LVISTHEIEQEKLVVILAVCWIHLRIKWSNKILFIDLRHIRCLFYSTEQ